MIDDKNFNEIDVKRKESKNYFILSKKEPENDKSHISKITNNLKKFEIEVDRDYVNELIKSKDISKSLQKLKNETSEHSEKHEKHISKIDTRNKNDNDNNSKNKSLDNIEIKDIKKKKNDSDSSNNTNPINSLNHSIEGNVIQEPLISNKKPIATERLNLVRDDPFNKKSKKFFNKKLKMQQY